MYFTEWDDSGGDPIALNEEFEAQYNAEEYDRFLERPFGKSSASDFLFLSLVWWYLSTCFTGEIQCQRVSSGPGHSVPLLNRAAYT